MPKYLLLPPNGICSNPPKLRLAYQDLGDWKDLHLLAVRAEDLPEFILMNPFPPPDDIFLTEVALIDGRVPAAEVPRLAGTADEPALYSVRSLMDALIGVGYPRFPILATEPAAKWLFKNVGVVPMPSDWTLVP